MFADSLDVLHANFSTGSTCLLGSSELEASQLNHKFILSVSNSVLNITLVYLLAEKALLL